jgi:hydroxymethylpyrimidine pyrophosphatase-like HAD family hydrolase
MMAEAEGLDVSECMAFGDGGNDISILKAAGIGVAMCNAADDVKAAADYVTTHVDDNGIANALRHYGAIK